MARTKRIFISDLHLSSKKLYDKGFSWFKIPDHQERLIKFIDKNIIGKSTIKDVILLGDIFNTWVCPAHLVPPTYEQIFTDNQTVLEQFKKIIADGIQLFYVNGNHDFDLKPEVIRAAIPGITVIDRYRSGRIHAEHGHRFDEVFNKPDYFCDPAFGRPIGYIISRLVTTFSSSGYGILDLPTYLDDIVEAGFTSQNIFESIIEGLAERADLDDNGIIQLPNNKQVTIKNVKERYSRLAEKYSTSEFIKELWNRSSLGWQADRLCKKENINICIFGHSHKALIDKDFFLVEDRIYANSGAWCKDNAYCVEVDKKVRGKITVKLYKVDADGKQHSPKIKHL